MEGLQRESDSKSSILDAPGFEEAWLWDDVNLKDEYYSSKGKYPGSKDLSIPHWFKSTGIYHQFLNNINVIYHFRRT